MQRGYLPVHLADGLLLRVDQTPQAGFQTGDMGKETQDLHGQPVLIPFHEEINADTAKHRANGQEHGHAGRHASTIKHQVQKNGEIQKL